jgi:hypothetical protein
MTSKRKTALALVLYVGSMALAGILKESERVLWNFIAELPYHPGGGGDSGKEKREPDHA